MVGQGVLRECLLDNEVEQVLVIGRREIGQKHAKVRELILEDLFDYASVQNELSGYDACFYCLGVTSSGMTEEAYRRVTRDMTVAAANALAKVGSVATFVFVSGAGADSTGTSRTMWARVKGEAENAVLEQPFEHKYMFRPAYIQPLHGITSRTPSYRVLYAILSPLYPLMKWLAPKHVTTTERVGRAMLAAAKTGAPKTVLENHDINALVDATDGFSIA